MLKIHLDENETVEEITKLLDGDLKEELNCGFGKFSPIYTFTSENIDGYLTKMNLMNKCVLTVCSSGDHIINSFLCGANDITAFDINIFSAFITELKIAALINLSYNQFLKFFMREDGNDINKNAFGYELYQELRGQLSNMTKVFFDKLYEIFDFDGSRIRECEIFNNKYDRNELKMMSNLYLHSENLYLKARESVKNKNINWVNCDVKYLQSVVNNKFDVIMLSNISDYAKAMFDNSNYLQSFADIIIKPLYNHLNDKGVICCAYIYDVCVREESQYRSQIDNPKCRKQIFSQFDYEEISFQSVIPDKKDMAVILTKS